jgi:hypothetical protein
MLPNPLAYFSKRKAARNLTEIRQYGFDLDTYTRLRREATDPVEVTHLDRIIKHMYKALEAAQRIK